MNDTMISILCARADRISNDALRLLRDFSGMRKWNCSVAGFTIVSITGEDYHWQPLSPQGKSLQVSLLPEFTRFAGLLQVLAQNLPGAARERLKCLLGHMRNCIEQDSATRWETSKHACEGFQKLTGEVISTLNEYFAPSSSCVIAIPDTNAFLANPDIESWQFDGIEHFRIVLTPTVLSELDAHKIHHKNPAVLRKASTIIRKLKDYRRRGSLLDGVTVVKGKSSIQAIPREPDMSQTLSWLVASNADDRFLATALEVIRDNLAAHSFVITLDLNMQNKAEMAAIPYREIDRAEENQEEA